MKTISKQSVGKVSRPIKVVQFGEGNFLRAFVDYMIDIANEKNCFDGDIVLVKPIQYGSLDYFRQQENMYTVLLRGQEKNEEKRIKRVVTSIADTVAAYEEYEKYAALARLDTLRFVVSNTTEAGIVYDAADSFELNPPRSYPGKLTKFLYERFEHFDGDREKGLIILPVELIDDNGIHLKEIVLRLAREWGLQEEFHAWLKEACIFCSTLVDRIVTGYPREEAESLWEEFGYEDNLMVTGEPFALWVIESDREIREEFALDKAGLPVIFTDDQKPYKKRKVRILNGAHTSFVPVSFLAGNDFVKESMLDEDIRKFMVKTVFEEIIPTLDLPKEDLLSFAEAVIDRFQNPFIKHALLSITLNSVSKWRARCMPSFLEYIDTYKKLPQYLTFSLAAMLQFYSVGELRDGTLIGRRGEEEYKIMDDAQVLEFFAVNKDADAPALTKLFLSDSDFWGQDLSAVPGAAVAVAGYLSDIREFSVREALKRNHLV